MRLFLSSQNLGNYPEVFLKMVGKGKLGVIHNAIDDWAPEDKKAKIEEHAQQLKDYGFDTTEIDLKDYYGKKKELVKKISMLKGLFIFGGNTFLLRRALADSDLDVLIKDLVLSDKLVYGGSSAGSIIMTPSLHGTEWGDDPSQVQKIYKKPIIWDALNLVPYYIVPHYETDWFYAEARAMEKYLKEHKLPHKILKDGEVIVIQGDKTELLK